VVPPQLRPPLGEGQSALVSLRVAATALFIPPAILIAFVLLRSHRRQRAGRSATAAPAGTVSRGEAAGLRFSPPAPPSETVTMSCQPTPEPVGEVNVFALTTDELTLK
jgi:hypothetical protein